MESEESATAALLSRLDLATVEHPVRLGDYDVTGVVGRGGMGAVYEAIDRARGTRVALKTVALGDVEAGIRLKREFRVVADLSHPNLAPVYALSWAEGLWFYAMARVAGRDFITWARGERAPAPSDLPLLSTVRYRGATPMDRTIRRREGPAPSRPRRGDDELRGAVIQIVRGVQALHDAGLRHGDLEPSNILVDDEGRVVVVDFGLTQPMGETHVSGGTPLYMAPELLSGEDASVGPWCDWYALGVTLYQALTGRIPDQEATSVFQLLSRRSAGPPPPPADLVASLPSDLCEVCERLLTPQIAERPDGDALLATLGGREPGGTSPGRAPIHDSFVGRVSELARLERALERARSGRCTIAHVHGPSGIGKSTLVRQFLGTVAALDLALVWTGRCYERENVPYKAFDGVVDALAGWMGSLERADVLRLLPRWTGELGRAFPALGPCLRVAAAAEPTAPDAIERRRRAVSAFVELVGRACVERPVVLFIDDLHWTDHDSAGLLDALVAGSPRSLLVLVSYRSREALDNRALAGHFARCRELGADTVIDLPLEPLPEDDARALASGRLREMRVSAADAWAPRLAREAAGVPFFIEVLGRFLRDRGTIDDSVSLRDAVVAAIDALPGAQRALVELVAVSDRPIPQRILFEAAELDVGDLAALLSLCSASLLRWSGAGPDDLVASHHDRIREVVLSELSEEALRRRHLSLGRAFAERCPAPVDGDAPWLFDAVRHLEAAEAWIEGDADRERAAVLHRAAGLRAQAAAAFPLARRCFDAGRRFLPKDAWEQSRELAFELALGVAECAWLGGDFASTDARLAEILEHVDGDLDRVRAHRVDIAARIARRDLLGAIDVARQGLRRLGVALPESPTDADVGAAVQRAMEALGDEGPGRLEGLADLEDVEVHAARTLLVDVTSAAYYAAPALLPIIACEIIVSSLDSGPSSATPFGLAVYGIVLNSLGMHRPAHEIGELAHRMIGRYEDRSLEVRTRLVVHNNVCVWTVPLQSQLDDLLATYEIGRADGDFEFAAIAAQCWATNAFVAGRDLVDVERTATRLGEFMREHHQRTALILHRPLERLIGCFRGRTATPASLSYDGFDEEETLAAAAAAGSASVAFVTLSDMLVARYHFGDPADAWAVACRALPFAAGAASTHHLATYHLYAPLAAAAGLRAAEAEARAAWLEAIDASITQLERWAEAGPTNFEHRLLLVRAERAAACGAYDEAAELYERAAQAAARTEYVNDAALIDERTGRFLMDRGDALLGGELLSRARDAYGRWGAKAKVAALGR